MPRHIATIVATGLLVVVAGCGKDASSSTAGSRTDLAITVVADEGVTPKVTTLTCDPAGGNHPQPAQACATLRKAGAGVFKPVPKGRSCTLFYGGPQIATVKGTYRGAKVDAAFKRTDGCEIDRWEKLGATFFNVPMQ